MARMAFNGAIQSIESFNGHLAWLKENIDKIKELTGE